MSLAQPYAPLPIDDLTLAFPAFVTHLMPAWSDIPEDFREERGDARRWIKFQRDWFFKGVPDAVVTAKEGIDREVALRHLAAIQRSYQPKHEHKEAAVAYLASLWLDVAS